ncbi:response regulator transcription factor [Aurantiacibacter luteus]|uniref:response regulator transcription factor n=1 Tax=Aurantiacibacter luteus TaxID=1581420 RepID=UPI000699ED52|nr:LuxR C-terminal-related transcriptional regulator [Aurantiacibacter luteus]
MDAIIRAMVAGALDHYRWPVEESDLTKLIADAKERELIWRKEESAREDAKRRIADLTSRERQVLVLIGRGFSNKGVARELGISPRTVEVHRANLYEKISAVSTADAVRIGIQAGLDLDA